MAHCNHQWWELNQKIPKDTKAYTHTDFIRIQKFIIHYLHSAWNIFPDDDDDERWNFAFEWIQKKNIFRQFFISRSSS